MPGTTRGSFDLPSIAGRLRRRSALAAFVLVLFAGAGILYPEYRNRSESLAAGLEANGRALVQSLLRLYGEAGSPARLAQPTRELGTVVLYTGNRRSHSFFPVSASKHATRSRPA